MRIKQDEPFEIQPRANAALARALRMGTAGALILSIGGVVIPGEVGRVLAWTAFTVVVAAPLARVALLGGRWIIRRDYMFSILAFALLAMVAAGGVLALRLQ